MILSFDLSLTCTGTAHLYADGRSGSARITTMASLSLRNRLRLLYNNIQMYIRDDDIDLLVIEGPSYGSKHGLLSAGQVRATFELAVAHYGHIPVLEVPPSALKILATGVGTAGKPEVVASAIRRLDYEGHDDNEADALWLCQAGAHHLGWDCAIDLPKTHLRALDKLEAAA